MADTDRELLKRAAAAAGPEVFGEPGCWFRYLSQNHSAVTGWNPLTDDGDALRLAARLYLWEAVRMAHRLVDDKTDIYAATRRAIVRAAAAMADSDVRDPQGGKP